ncbi:hypothetical protein PspLS_01590 [Pyricularia sp. CBS 133598]|nr:hypothetical protein PspLS_01590 [Pyricularia sp. CBS 133598]
MRPGPQSDYPIGSYYIIELEIPALYPIREVDSTRCNDSQRDNDASGVDQKGRYFIEIRLLRLRQQRSYSIAESQHVAPSRRAAGFYRAAW